MKTQHFFTSRILRAAAATLILPFQMLPVAEGETLPQYIEVEDIAKLCVRVCGIGETGIGRPIGTTGATRYEIDGIELRVYLAPEERIGDISVTVDGTYGEVRLHAVIVATVADDGQTEVELKPYIFAAIAAGGGGADYKTDMYMDGAGRVIVERLEDGSTLILDEHENPIIQRNADGSTQYFDAYQSARLMISADGNVEIAYTESGVTKTLALAEQINKSVKYTNNGSIVIGSNSYANGIESFSAGGSCHANGRNSHAEGGACAARAEASHAEGGSTIASGNNSHAEGYYSEAKKVCSHAEGLHCISNGNESHAEGTYCTTNSGTSHAEGNYCETGTNGGSAHAEGSYTNANGAASHTEGYRTVTTEGGSHAQGCWNKVEGGAYAFMHGCGTGEADRKNAFLIAGDEAYMLGVGGYDGTNYGAEGVQSVQTVIRSLQLKLINL